MGLWAHGDVAVEGETVSDYPQHLTPAGHVEPVPRRVRAYVGAQCVLDTSAARYVWEWPAFPQFYVPLADVAPGILVDEDVVEERPLGPARRHGVRSAEVTRSAAGWVPTSGELVDAIRFQWRALDAWFEEDEQVFVHPRSPYTRVDALRSARRVRVELDGVVLAESASPVLVFETGLPTRHYLPRTDVRLENFEPSDTVTECPYKGRTSAYWSARTPSGVASDVAWSYDFPTAALLPIAGLVAFYDERVDTYVDGRLRDRPVTHFSR